MTPHVQIAPSKRPSPGGVAVIVGEAGIGKTSVVATLTAEAHRRGFRSLCGRCYESEQILPFGPWVTALREGRVMSDERLLAGLNPVWRAELARLLPETWAPGDQAPTDDPRRLFESVARLIERLAAEQPILVTLEDLHWADEMSLRLLGFLARRMAGARVLVAVTAREEDVPVASILGQVIDELAREPHVTLLRLSPLTRSDTAALVRALSRAGRHATVVAQIEDQVWSLSQGNPFVAVEALRALREGMAPIAAGTLPLPERVRHVIATRLDHLAASSRQILAVAAVIGRECDFAVLARAGGLGADDTAVAIEELVRRRVLSGVGERLEFVHDRIRDVAYGQLLPPRRKLVHARVGDAIETVQAERLAEVADRLAYHYAEAGNAGKAVEYLTVVGQNAAHAYAHDDAVAAFRQASNHAARLPAAERDPRLAEIVLQTASSLHFLGRYRDAVDLLLEHEARIERLADPAVAGRYHFLLGRYYSQLADPRATVHARRALEEATRCGDRATLGRAHFVLSSENFWFGRFREGIEHGREAVRLLEESGERWWAGTASWMVGMICNATGEFDAGLAAESQTEAIGRLIGDDHLVNCAAWASGWILATRGDGAAGAALSQQALAASRDHFNTSRATVILGYSYLQQGAAKEAVAILERALDGVTRSGIRRLQGLVMAWLADASLLNGDAMRACELARQALDIATAVECPFAIASSQRTLGRVDHACAKFEPAERHLTDAHELFSSIGAAFEAGRTRLDLAALAAPPAAFRRDV